MNRKFDEIDPRITAIKVYNKQQEVEVIEWFIEMGYSPSGLSNYEGENEWIVRKRYNLDNDTKCCSNYGVSDLEGGYKLIDYNDTKLDAIGYIAPYDMYGGIIKKGDIFKPINGNKKTWKTDTTGPTQYSLHLPREIVEKWEAVYPVPKSKNVYIGDTRFKIERDQISTKDGLNTILIDPSFIKSLITPIVLTRSDYYVNIQEVKVGCKTFSRDNLIQLINEYEKFNA